jgi:hypothetical protein
MAKVRTTLTIDDAVLRVVKLRAARSGRGDSEVIEESLRRDWGLDLLERMWERSELTEKEAHELAVDAQHAAAPALTRLSSSSTSSATGHHAREAQRWEAASGV